jgi:hypothetical protein
MARIGDNSKIYPMIVMKPVITAILTGFLFFALTSCSRTEEVSGPVISLGPDENLAASNKGARAIASSSVSAQFAIANLNDGTPEAWGAAEGNDDVYAAVVLPTPKAIREIRLSLFSPNLPPRAHLRDIRVVAADSEDKNGPNWRVVRSRLAKEQPFSEKVTVPPLDDGSYVRIEIDPSDPNKGAHKIWGVACFTASHGDARNYLEPGKGTGIYVRELQMK